MCVAPGIIENSDVIVPRKTSGRILHTAFLCPPEVGTECCNRTTNRTGPTLLGSIFDTMLEQIFWCLLCFPHLWFFWHALKNMAGLYSALKRDGRAQQCCMDEASMFAFNVQHRRKTFATSFAVRRIGALWHSKGSLLKRTEVFRY